MEPVENCRCSLFTRSPCLFSHGDEVCGWPDLAQVCPDCGRDGEACSFFAENEEENACTNFTRLTALCIRCELDGLKQRREPQVRRRLIILSGGEGSQRGVAFATKHADTYKDSMKVVDGAWMPQDLSTPDTVFYWDRNVVPWRFSLEPTSGAESVTMRGLLGSLGILEGRRSATSSTPQPDIQALAAQVQQLTETVQQLAQMRIGSAGTTPVNPAAEAAQAAESLRVAHAGNRAANQEPLRIPGSPWNPSQTFNLGAQSGSGVVFNQNNDVALAQVLASQGATADQIMRFLQSRTPTPPPTEHRTAWLQVLEGTSPLCVYTGLHGETRKAATAKVLHVQTHDGPNKLSMKVSAWPPARPEDVEVFAFRELGADWKRGLAQGNIRMLNITPTADRVNVPQLPIDVDGFLEQLYSCLRTYDHVSVLRGWEAAHHFMVDEVVARRSQPSWSTMWMMPVFQAELRRTTRTAEGSTTFDVKKCCLNWNLRKGQKCTKDPDPSCAMLHICMRCGGEHRICECSRE